MDTFGAIKSWWKDRQNRKEMEAVRKFVFRQATEHHQHKGIIQVVSRDDKDNVVSKWNIYFELNPTYPQSFVEDWERAKVKIEEIETQLEQLKDET